MNVRIFTDSVADLPESWLKEHPNVTVIDTPIILGHPDGLEQVTLWHQTPNDFKDIERKYLRKGYRATTSTPNIYSASPESELEVPSIEHLTRQALDCGKSVVYLAMSSSLSSTYDYVAALYDQIRAEGHLAPGQRLLCIDTGCMSTGLGFAVMEIAELLATKDSTAVLEYEIAEICRHTTHVFSLNDFKQIKASGKMPTAKAAFAQLLHINPFMGFVKPHADSSQGRELLSVNNRIRKEDELIEVMAEFVAMTIADPHSHVIAAHGNCPKRGKKLAAALRDRLPEAEILTGDDWRIGPSVQVHVGTTTIATFYAADREITADDIEAAVLQILRDRRQHS